MNIFTCIANRVTFLSWVGLVVQAICSAKLANEFLHFSCSEKRVKLEGVHSPVYNCYPSNFQHVRRSPG